ncbi:MAG TPA: PDDEXK nuclease domain-containing protein [Enterococcus sp.]|nr:PDDEXK nuclease domain-containing protein [Enterococcus sp.]
MAKKTISKTDITEHNFGDELIAEISSLIENSKKEIVKYANSSMTMLFWQIGKVVNQKILENKRAEYGKEIIVTLSRHLVNKYGRNFEEKNLRRMLQFASQFTEREIVVTLSRHLTWSHFLILIPLKKNDAKLFYAQRAINDNWGVRELKKQISTKVFERTALANTQLKITQPTASSVFKDPYFLDFLGLKDDYLERDLETAILKELEKFILELGKGFAFVERQKRMIIDGEDFYLDLLFYHRNLKRLVAIELKLGKFQAKYKGQMELYLKWLNRYERKDDELPPVGLILCAESSREQVELLEMHKDGILVAEYWTELPPKKELERLLHKALSEAKERIEIKKLKE